MSNIKQQCIDKFINECLPNTTNTKKTLKSELYSIILNMYLPNKYPNGEDDKLIFDDVIRDLVDEYIDDIIDDVSVSISIDRDSLDKLLSRDEL